MTVCEMTTEFADRIAGWTYSGDYAFYNCTRDEETIRELLDGSYFASTDEEGGLTGYYCFGGSARIPTEEADAYAADLLDIGLGMRPDLCGRGGGAAFLTEGVAFARMRFGATGFRLTVASFNLRAIRAYERAGFAIDKQIAHGKSGMVFYVMKKTGI